MTTETKISNEKLVPRAMLKRVIQGAVLALILIAIFLSGVGEPHPSWPPFWYLRPLIIVPLAGASGGTWVYYINQLRREGGWNKVFTLLISILGYVIALWLGTVLGLDGTLWD